MSEKSFDERADAPVTSRFSHADWIEAMKSRADSEGEASTKIDLASDTFPCAKKAIRR